MLDRLRSASLKLTAPPWPHIAAWLCVAILIFVTLCPIGLRPKTGLPNFERPAAYFLTGSAFLIAYARRWPLVIIGVAVLAATLEGAQYFIPTRDPRLVDAMVKIAGGETGIACALLARRWLPGWFAAP